MISTRSRGNAGLVRPRMETSSHTIRLATTSDAPALATLAERTFRDTFAATNTPENMDEHCRRSFGEEVQAAEIRNPNIITLVAESNGCLVGYAQLRPGADAPGCVPGCKPAEIHRLYVAAEFHGKGLAQALISASNSALGERSCDVAWLGVWEQNPRAISFYRKCGFVEVGEHVFLLGSDSQRDVIMALRLPSQPAPTETGNTH